MRLLSTTWKRALAAATVSALMGAACSGGSGHSRSSPQSQKSASASASASREVHLLTIGTVNLQRAGAGGKIGDRAKHAVLDAAQRYVNKAVLAPLETGRVGRGYGDLFVPGIRPAATGADEGVLTDSSMGKTSALKEESTAVAMSALTGPAGVLLYVATKFRVSVHATRGSGEITIDRNIELTFEPVNQDWLITAYRVDVTRHTPARKAPVTTRARANP